MTKKNNMIDIDTASNKDIKIINYDDICGSTPKPYIIEQIKSPFRMILSSKSAGGKTNLLLNLLLNPLIYYEKLIVFSTTLGQEKYQFLINFFEDLYQEEVNKYEKKSGKKMTISKMINSKFPLEFNVGKMKKFKDTMEESEPPERMAFFYDDMNSLPRVSEVCDDCNTLIVVDDCVLEKNQTKIIEYFVKGRHKKISVIYQTQKFTALPTIMREQASHYIFIGKQDNQLLKTISMSVPLGLGYDSFKKLFKMSVIGNFDFVLLNMTEADEKKIIYRNLNEPINLSDVRVE